MAKILKTGRSAEDVAANDAKVRATVEGILSDIEEGGDEKANGVVQIKDLALGARLSAEIETAQEWKKQPAQMEIKRADLVDEVRKMIARAEGLK